tara:strand:- start:7636 stop:8487 length:852 start_codon:yes stop_codon:yes gene_type:complete
MPAIAVIIPTYNRPDALKYCLDSLKTQTLNPSLWEVIVINDGGCAIEELGSGYGENFRFIRQENAGPANARNFGVSLAKSQIITFLDDDCQAQPTWLENILNFSKEGVLLGGKVFNSYTENIYSEGSQLLIDFLYSYQHNTPNQFFTSNNFSLYKSDFDRFGGFDSSFSTSAGEDREFCVRLQKNGMNLIFNPQILIKHRHFLDLWKFIKLHKKYGKAAVLFQKSAKEQDISIDRRPKLNFYRKLFFYPFTLEHKPFPTKIALSLSLALSQFCVVWGFLDGRR